MCNVLGRETIQVANPHLADKIPSERGNVGVFARNMCDIFSILHGLEFSPILWWLLWLHYLLTFAFQFHNYDFFNFLLCEVNSMYLSSF